MHQTDSHLAQALSDEAIYRRTDLGQRELIRLGEERLSMSGRILARINGYTDLRRLIDLSPEDPQVIGTAVLDLLGRKLIEKVQA